MRVVSIVAGAVALCCSGASFAQQTVPLQPNGTPIAPAGVEAPLTGGPWTFKTAEGMDIKVTALLQGIVSPYGIGFLPNGDLLITQRNGELRLLNDKMEELRRESLLTELHVRIRDVQQGPDGFLYATVDSEQGAILRIEPAK